MLGVSRRLNLGNGPSCPAVKELLSVKISDSSLNRGLREIDAICRQNVQTSSRIPKVAEEHDRVRRALGQSTDPEILIRQIKEISAADRKQ